MPSSPTNAAFALSQVAAAQILIPPPVDLTQHSFNAASSSAVLYYCTALSSGLPLHSILLYSFLFTPPFHIKQVLSPCLEVPTSPTALRCILTHFICTPTDPSQHVQGIILPFNPITLQNQEQAPLSKPSLPAPKRMTLLPDTQRTR